MAEQLWIEFRAPLKRPHPIERIEMLAGSGGVFDVSVNDEVVFSKHAARRHAEIGEIVDALRQRLPVA